MNKDFIKVDIEEYFRYVPKTIKKLIKESPYRSQSRMVDNIYYSVLLTLISSITISYQNKRRISKNMYRGDAVANIIEDIYKEEAKDVILWHLPSHMENYIIFLTNKAKHIINKDISYIVGTYKMSDSLVRDILSLPAREDMEELNQND